MPPAQWGAASARSSMPAERCGHARSRERRPIDGSGRARCRRGCPSTSAPEPADRAATRVAEVPIGAVSRVRRTPLAIATQSDEVAVTGHQLVAASGQILLAANTVTAIGRRADRWQAARGGVVSLARQVGRSSVAAIPPDYDADPDRWESPSDHTGRNGLAATGVIQPTGPCPDRRGSDGTRRPCIGQHRSAGRTSVSASLGSCSGWSSARAGAGGMQRCSECDSAITPAGGVTSLGRGPAKEGGICQCSPPRIFHRPARGEDDDWDVVPGTRSRS